MRTPKFLADLLPTLKFRREGFVTMRVTSVFGVPHLPKRPGPAASTWITDVDFLVVLRVLVTQVLPFRFLNAFRTNSGSHLLAPTSAVLMKERNVPASFLKRQLVLPDGRVLVDLLVELGLGHFDRLRVLLHIANLHRLSTLMNPPQFLRDALLLQTFEDRVHQAEPAKLHMGQQFESTREILARTIRWRVGRSTFGSLEVVLSCSTSRTGRRMPRTTFCTASSPSYCCHHAPSRLTGCNLPAGIGDNVGTRTTV